MLSPSPSPRYLHYYTRFTNHHNSLKFEIEAKGKMEQKIKEMEALGDNTWMDCQYLNEANEALYNCRYTLKFTYVFAFYLPRDDNFRLQFENQQTELERQTEALAELLEKDVSEIHRMEVVTRPHPKPDMPTARVGTGWRISATPTQTPNPNPHPNPKP